MSMGYWQEGMGWWMIFGGIWMLVFWALLIALVVWGIKKLTEHGDHGSGTTQKRDPLDIAKDRYARGDISREEFKQIKQDLS
jgi:putative membrane protein